MRFFFCLFTCVMLFFSATLSAEIKKTDKPEHVTEKSFAEQPAVQKFIDEMVTNYHFNAKKLTNLFNTVKPKPTVIQSVKTPLEKQPWYIYRLLFVTRWRTHEGAIFWKKNAALLEKAEKIYGVPAAIIVATLGIETKYGVDAGKYRVIDSLSNLAFSHSTRAPFFRSQLKEFLLLCREQNFDPYTLKGSYAGAIGQVQFTPESYRRYATHFPETTNTQSNNKNKKIDLFHNEADIIASIANYYKNHGWLANQPIAERIDNQNKREKLLKKFAAKERPQVIELEDYFFKESWVTYHNFSVIKRYNTSDLYAMAVIELGNKISLLKGKKDAA